MTTVTTGAVERWIADRLAERLGTAVDEIDVHRPWQEFGLESNEALMLTGELESWLSIEIETTALWHHPTIAELSAFVVEELGRHVSPS